MPILDGEHVEADQIDLAKHRFIGTWRPPVVPKEYTKKWCNCPCGDELNHTCSGGIRLGPSPFNHWQNGCFDEPQYVTIQPVEKGACSCDAS